MATFTIKKGLDIKLAGAPEALLGQTDEAAQVAVVPTEYTGIKFRLTVKEGDTVKRGQPIAYDKKNEAFKLCAPAGGTVSAVILGKRRVIQRVVIDVATNEEAESFETFSSDALKNVDRNQLLDVLNKSGLIALLTARPFSRIARSDTLPKSIFVNGMNTAPFQPDINFSILGQEEDFQAGLNALSNLTDGKVNLCLDQQKDNVSALKDARNVDVHTFSGPHPSGNSSVHIHNIDAISPGDVVWTIKAQDVILIGQLLTKGTFPTHRVISLGGPAVKEGSAKHYRVRLGASLDKLFADNTVEGDLRFIGGDMLSGEKISADSFLRLHDRGITVMAEDSSREFLGWMAPGLNKLGTHKTYLSAWFGKNRTWSLGTNQRGELRAMVLTGLYDKYVPMEIMTDYLVRAVLAKDTDEAIALGLLETDPEDFALCSFVCPSKMDLCSVIRKGLDLIEKEGI